MIPDRRIDQIIHNTPGFRIENLYVLTRRIDIQGKDLLGGQSLRSSRAEENVLQRFQPAKVFLVYRCIEVRVELRVLEVDRKPFSKPQRRIRYEGPQELNKALVRDGRIVGILVARKAYQFAPRYIAVMQIDEFLPGFSD